MTRILKEGTMTFILEIEDLTNLGGPMGTEYTTSEYKYFNNQDNAKRYAEKHYDSGKTRIEWSRRDNYITSGDLGSVMYTIRELVTSDNEI